MGKLQCGIYDETQKAITITDAVTREPVTESINTTVLQAPEAAFLDM